MSSGKATSGAHTEHILNLSQKHQSIDSQSGGEEQESSLVDMDTKHQPPAENGSLKHTHSGGHKMYGSIDGRMHSGQYYDEGLSDTTSEHGLLLPKSASREQSLDGSHLRQRPNGSAPTEEKEFEVDCKDGSDSKGWMRRQLSKINVRRSKELLNSLKIALIFISTLICTGLFVVHPELDYYIHQYSVSLFDPYTLNATGISEDSPILTVFLTGSFLDRLPAKTTKNVTVKATNPATGTVKEQVWVIADHDELGDIEETIVDQRFDFSGEELDSNILVEIRSTTVYSVPVSAGYIFQSTAIYNEVIYATVILFFVYVLIIFDLVHRALAAMLGALAALSVLAVLNMKPSLEEVLTWMDYDTLCLLFGMMIIVSIFCETGFFDWLALQSYKVTKGRTWPLITILCLFSAVTSAFLDNVTTILLLAPVTIRLCEVMELDPKHILMAEVLFSNIGGTSTAIGDPPNVIIVGSSGIKDASNGKVNFATFTAHMMVGSVFTTIAAYGLLRFMYRKKRLLKHKDPIHIHELRIEIAIWKRQMKRVAVTSREGALVKKLLEQKIRDLQQQIKQQHEQVRNEEVEDFKSQVAMLEEKYVIKDKWLLIKCGCVIIVVILTFFMHSFFPKIDVTIGWIAMLGAMWLLVLSDNSDLESVLHRIEWATLLFFAALFILMEGLTKLNLMDFIADQASGLIMKVDDDKRLAVAIVVIVWISALASSFIDNIPFTTAMVPVIVRLADDPSLGLPLDPLVWSLAFGACLGGNGTLIGASANVVCAGLAEANEHPFSFWEFFKVGFPTMLVTTFIAMCYLLVCHVAFDWSIN